jgi:hypothetical protein
MMLKLKIPPVYIISTLLIVAALLYFLRRMATRKELFQNTNRIPKKIWSYWDNPDKMPEVVRMSIDSWKKYNPDYEIHVLNKSDFKNYAHIPNDILNHPNFKDSPARFSDLLRLFLIEEHGGIWIDASSLMYEGFDTWLPNAECFLYVYNQGATSLPPKPIVESWFFAAAPHNDFIKRWRDEFAELKSFATVDAYVKSRKYMGVDFASIENKKLENYLAVYISAQKVLQIDAYPLEKLTIKMADEPFGPLYYIIKHDWDTDRGLQGACKDVEVRKPFMKLISYTRNDLEKRLHTDLSNSVCKWI